MQSIDNQDKRYVTDGYEMDHYGHITHHFSEYQGAYYPPDCEEIWVENPTPYTEGKAVHHDDKLWITYEWKRELIGERWVTKQAYRYKREPEPVKKNWLASIWESI